MQRRDSSLCGYKPKGHTDRIFVGVRWIGASNESGVEKYHFTSQCTLVHRAVLRSHAVRLSVTLVDCDHIG